MATFYKYKEREDISKSMIDWSGLTKEISDNLIKEKNRRDNLKLELEQDQLQKIKAVEEFTRGLDPSMNQKMIEISDQYKDFLLMNHRLMKQGLVSVNDTKIKKQGAIDTFNAINDAATQYNQKISEFIDTGGSLNEYMALHAAEGLNLSNSELVIDDMGRGTFIKIDENGNEIAIPATTFSTLLNTKYDVFDAPAAFDKVTENLATYTIAQSGYRSVTDFRQNKELYNGWLNNSVKSILSGDKKIAEVASAFNIDITRDKEEAKRDGLILSEYKNGKLVFNVDYVKDKVENIVKNGIESRIDRIEKETPKRESSSRPSDKSIGFDREASSLYNLSTRAARGESVAFDQIEGRLYFVTDEKGNKKSVKLSRPTLTDDGNILITDANGREILNIPSGPDASLAIANIIRSGESADTVQSLFEQGERLSSGKLPPLKSDVEERTALVSALSDMPVNEDAALKWLESNLPTDIKVDIPWAMGDYIRLTKGQDSVKFETKDIDGIKNWLDKYDATPMTTGNKGNKGNKGKRTIAQIMKEDGVSRKEAIKIFKNQ